MSSTSPCSRCPAGVPGELYIGGAGLARGYLGQPGQTADRFVPDPFGATPGGRLYRTGDRVRFLPDGRIAFIERIDAQVKVRGFRIELGEIEATLARHQDIAQAAVLPHVDAGGQTRLVAYVAPHAPDQQGHVPADLAFLATFLGERLPAYMVPSAFVAVDALPLSTSGKIDRKALARRPAPELVGPATAYEAPSTETEATLAALWSSLLGVERVGRQDDFFALGGHSLLATRVLARMRAELDVDLPLRTLFTASTLAALAAEIDGADAGALPADRGRDPRRPAAPLLRPGAPVVPGPARARPRDLPHSLRAHPARRPGAAGAGPCLRRSARPPRRPAHDLRRPRGPAEPGGAGAGFVHGAVRGPAGGPAPRRARQRFASVSRPRSANPSTWRAGRSCGPACCASPTTPMS